MTRVAIVDYGVGNVHSIGRVLTDLGIDWLHTRDESELRSVTHLLLPGVGHCAQAMCSLNETGTADVLNDLVLRVGTPVLGICLGMQLMTMHSAEGDTKCLGWFENQAVRIAPVDRKIFKVPNIGWHTVDASPHNALFSSVDSARKPFYFCHAYAVAAEGSMGVGATFKYERKFAASLQRRNIMGVQFHPEKSQEAGAALLSNFVGMDCRNV